MHPTVKAWPIGFAIACVKKNMFMSIDWSIKLICSSQRLQYALIFTSTINNPNLCLSNSRTIAFYLLPISICICLIFLLLFLVCYRCFSIAYCNLNLKYVFFKVISYLLITFENPNLQCLYSVSGKFTEIHNSFTSLEHCLALECYLYELSQVFSNASLYIVSVLQFT